MWTIGFLPTVPVFVTAYMWFEGRESWKQIVPQVVILTGFMYIVFDRLLYIPWPPTLAGSWFPVLKMIPSI